jgi:hypothetical protein
MWSTTMSERFLTRHEAAEMMRLDYRTLGNLGRRGPPFVKTSRVRGKCLYRESDIVAFLQGNADAHAAASEATSRPTDGTLANGKAKRQPKAATTARKRRATSVG